MNLSSGSCATKLFISVAVALLIAMAPQDLVAQGSPNVSVDDEYLPGHLWVRFVDDALPVTGGGRTGYAVFDQSAAAYGVFSVEKGFPFVDAMARNRRLLEHADALRSVYIVRYRGQYAAGIVAAELARDPAVIYAEPYYIRRTVGMLPPPGVGALPDVPNDPLFKDETFMARMRMTDAWDVVKGESGDVVIAIVDSGPLWRHEDLIDNVWTNPGEVADNGIDDDNNGFVDDVHGWNFTDDKPDPTGADIQEQWHGTQMTGAAAAVADNEKGSAGTSWNARFMPISISCTGIPGSLCYASQGVVYAAMNGADIINASWGGTRPAATDSIILRVLREEGILMVASAGNAGVNIDEKPFYPAAYLETLSVGGTASHADVNLLNFGSTVDVFAAAQGVYSTFPPPYHYHTTGGTSGAAALVSGIAALVKTIHPTYTGDQIREQLRSTADNIDSENAPELHGLLGRGRVNAYRAVTESGFPAVRLTDWNWIDSGGDSKDLRSSETMTITAEFTNYLADAEGLTLELVSDSPHITVSSGPETVGTLATNESHTATFTAAVADDAPYRTPVVLRIRAISGTYVDELAGALPFTLNPARIASLNSNPWTILTVTSEGNIGFVDNWRDPLSILGRGWLARSATDGQKPILVQGGLILATGPGSVSDCMPRTGTFLGGYRPQNIDFLEKPGTALSVDFGAVTAREARVELTDQGADNPIGIEILQRTYLDVNPAAPFDGYGDVIVLRYTLTNTTNRTITDLHVGIWSDFIFQSATDSVTFDEGRGIGIFIDHFDSSVQLAGTKVLTADAPLHHAAFEGYVDRRYALADADHWAMLSGGIQPLPDPGDSGMQMIGAGPYTILPGSKTEVAFALVTGVNREKLFEHADRAQTLWDDVISTVDQPAHVQLIQNTLADPVDVYVNGARILDDWATQMATGFRQFDAGPLLMEIVPAGDPDNANPLVAESFVFDMSESYNIIINGSGGAVSLLAVDDVRRQADDDGMADFYVVHGAQDLDAVDLRLLNMHDNDGWQVLAEDFSFNTATSYTSIVPGVYNIEVAVDGSQVGVYQFDLREAAGKSFMLGLRGSGTSAAEGVTLIGVRTDGSAFYPMDVTDHEEDPGLPLAFALRGNYPNPFASSTRILFDLPAPARVSVKVIDMLGRTVMRLPPVEREAGSLRKVDLDASHLASGTYMYSFVAEMATNTVVDSDRMVVVK